jgi:hypothetical protein
MASSSAAVPEDEFPDRDKLIDKMIEKGGGFSDFGKVDLLHAASAAA